jgi:hypothetical protein
MRGICILVTTVTVVASVQAQQTIHDASVSGRVLDPAGAIVQQARVTARHLETKLVQTTESDGEGRFRFPYLKVGQYEVTIQKPGFGDVVHEIQLGIGAAHELPVQLAVQSAEARVVVSADAAVLETARSQIASTVSQTEIVDLPLNGRNFLDLALLVPGVSPTNTASTQLFPETSAVAGQGLSINSQRNFSNSYIVDGLSANDDAAGLSGMPYSIDAIHEFQVVTSGGQAEFGRALGGYMNAVTRSGTNSLHGTLYAYLRDQRLNAKNVLSGTKLPYTQTQYGASLGGPLIRERTFYFGNFEQRRLNQSGLVTISPTNVSAINTRLIASGYKGPLVTTGLYPNPVDSSNLLARVDHQIRPNDLLTVRYSVYDVASQNSRGVGGLSAPTAASGLDNMDHNVAISNVATLSPRVVNETRGQYIRSQLAAEPNDLVGPAVTISGVATFGRLSSSPTKRVNDLYEVVNNFSVHAGAHALRFGGQFLHNTTTITFPRSIRGGYTFSSLANFQNGVYNNAGFTQTFGPFVAPLSNPNAGLYVQDEWKANSRLTLNVGLRYDLQWLNTIVTDRNNVSPRLGITWAPLKSRRTVVRSSYGLFYDRIPLRALANALLSSGNTTMLTSASQISVGLSPTQVGAPVFPNTLATTPAAVLVNFTTMDRYMQNACAVQGSVEVEQQIASHSTISVGYQHLRGLHLIASINQNVPTCVAAGTNNGCRPNPNFANNTQYSPAADSRYNGLSISFVQRPRKWGHYRLSYTYSKSMNNVGEFFFSSPIDNFNIWQDWARSDDDQRHRLVMTGTVKTSMSPARGVWGWLRHGYQLTGMLQYYSALPFNITTGSTTVQGTIARPLVNGAFLSRNAGTGFDRLNVNIRVSRSFSLGEKVQLQALGEMFNVTNRVNGITLNGTFGPGTYPTSPLPTFRQTTAVQEPRGGQIALRITF